MSSTETQVKNTEGKSGCNESGAGKVYGYLIL